MPLAHGGAFQEMAMSNGLSSCRLHRVNGDKSHWLVCEQMSKWWWGRDRRLGKMNSHLHESSGHVFFWSLLRTVFLAFCQPTISMLQSAGAQQSQQQGLLSVKWVVHVKHWEQCLALSKHSVHIIDTLASCIFIWNFSWVFNIWRCPERINLEIT